jgi:4-hydroxy-2-oxoheptanedioate aldolase
MRQNKLKVLWRAGKPVATGWCQTPDPFVAEAMTRAGFDALVLDMQHGMSIGPDRAGVWLQIVGQSDIAPLVRIPWNEPAFAQWVLDAGAMGLIIPMISTVEDAKKALGACKYPPMGYRSNGPNRASFFGKDYFARANEDTLCLLMMETVEGVQNIEQIAQLPGCDGFFIGPTDLAISMGLPPTMDCQDPRHVAMVQKVIDTAKKYGENAGIYTTGAEESVRRWKQGFNLNPFCADVATLVEGVNRKVAELRKRLAE